MQIAYYNHEPQKADRRHEHTNDEKMVILACRIEKKHNLAEAHLPAEQDSVEEIVLSHFCVHFPKAVWLVHAVPRVDLVCAVKTPTWTHTKNGVITKTLVLNSEGC